jgi:hypothetical protein
MDAIKTAALPASFALAESVCCSVEILFTVASTTVLSSSMINTRRKDTISKIRTISETGNSNTAGIKITATANQCGRQFHHKMCFLRPASCSQMLSTIEAKFSFSHALRVA